MISCSKSDQRRCRPLLGTFVEISASGLDSHPLSIAIRDAFAAVEQIQRQMSVHDESSEMSEVNRAAHLHPVRVHEQTFEVLERGLALARECNGAFDFTVGSTLAQWGLRPRGLQRKRSGDWRDIELLPDRRISFRRPLAIDLGGIAKGYAVDAAIAVLVQHGVATARVNAGGDLRVFGPKDSWVHLRHPNANQLLPNPISLRNAALATSSPGFTRKPWRGQIVSHLVNTTTSRPVTDRISVTIRASECWVADALTKVVLNAPEIAGRLLEKHRAEAFVLSA